MSGLRFDFEPAAVTLREGIDDRYAKSGAAIALRGEERFENPVFDLRGNARTVIADFNPGSTFARSGQYSNRALPFQCIDGIKYQVDDCSDAIRRAN